MCCLQYPTHLLFSISLFFFNDPATTEIYTLSLHDALPIYFWTMRLDEAKLGVSRALFSKALAAERSEEHTSELQSQSNHVCRLLLEKKRTPLTDALAHLPITEQPLQSTIAHMTDTLRDHFLKGTGPPRILPFSLRPVLPN